MNVVRYLKENGMKRAIQVVWDYKIEKILEKLVFVFTKNSELKDIIMIESHNDFDCNGGAFYEYLLKHGYNKKYKIVWLVRKRVNKTLPENVTTVPLFGPNLRKAYYICTAKYFTYDCDWVGKMRKDQIAVYCDHGAGGLKSVKGKLYIPKEINYVLALSPQYQTIQKKEYSLNENDERLVSIGYPAQDTLFDDDVSEINKITSKKYKKVIIWMPTFRRGGGYKRNDSTKEQKYGIPLIDNLKEYDKINDILNELDMLLLIKIHPKQNLSNLGIMNKSNIFILTGADMKKMEVDNYRLMKCTDVMISDYSSVAYDYLQLNRPIAYVLDDMNDYINGFVVDNIHKLIAGKEIYTLDDMKDFFYEVSNEKDLYKEKREVLRNYIYDYHDNKSSERLAKLLDL